MFPAVSRRPLKTIDISPSEITFLAFSHLHFDHTGNAYAFDSSTWILNKDEIAWAEATPTPLGVAPDSFAASRTAKTQMTDGDYDVFGEATRTAGNPATTLPWSRNAGIA
ncbi:MAG: hypothetical protein AUH41_11590 [Gemmatimonadetes bacterium 13_1_40CM_66_11]|nr:MAG: hypothetical protein AUH41_11590 [Gemmatimonadetes bacterium 13_1_40CM_66_11]